MKIPKGTRVRVQNSRDYQDYEGTTLHDVYDHSSLVEVLLDNRVRLFIRAYCLEPVKCES
jgi:hypothetical protein